MLDARLAGRGRTRAANSTDPRFLVTETVSRSRSSSPEFEPRVDVSNLSLIKLHVSS